MDSYAKWLEKEQELVEQITQENKALAIKMSILCIPGCALLLGFIGLISGGGVSGTLQNMLWGLIFGVFTALFVLLLTPKPRKRHAKTLEMYMKELTPEEKEEFGSQMLSPDVKTMSFKDTDKTKTLIKVTKSFLVVNYFTGDFRLERLDKVAKIETAVVDMSVTARSNGMRMRINNEAYGVEFYYKKPDGSIPKMFDSRCAFPTRELRGQAMLYIKEAVNQRLDPPIILEN